MGIQIPVLGFQIYLITGIGPSRCENDIPVLIVNQNEQSDAVIEKI